LTSLPHRVQSAGQWNKTSEFPNMDLPESVAAIGERLSETGAIVTDPQLLHGADVFAAERDRIFMRRWVAVDHQTRLDGDRCYLRFDSATRSFLVTRDEEGGLHALRNVCLHAGYPICDAEGGPAERLICPYHGWEFSLKGRLVEPDLSARIDPARLQLASYPVAIHDGLIFVDPSSPAVAGESATVPVADGAVPEWLAESNVTARSRYSTNWNWKLALQFVKSSPHLFADELDDDANCVAFGPLSLMMVQPQQAALLRVIPKSAERTDIQLVRMEPKGASPSTPAADGADRVADGLQQAGDAEAVARTSELDRQFLAWYWSLMAAE
jgi:nitrite reductase/ring-hydroxylating ferredoxin subunit